eukprot:7826894-Prorocentrum_lima.AAC.1
MKPINPRVVDQGLTDQVPPPDPGQGPVPGHVHLQGQSGGCGLSHQGHAQGHGGQAQGQQQAPTGLPPQ